MLSHETMSRLHFEISCFLSFWWKSMEICKYFLETTQHIPLGIEHEVAKRFGMAGRVAPRVVWECRLPRTIVRDLQKKWFQNSRFGRWMSPSSLPNLEFWNSFLCTPRNATVGVVASQTSVRWAPSAILWLLVASARLFPGEMLSHLKKIFADFRLNP